MTIQQPTPIRGARTRTTRTPTKPHGQWAVDGNEPLNANEEFKLADGGLNVRERIENEYAKGGFASIDPTDLHGRFRWWGLYTQRKPGIDGGRTAQLEPHELEDEYFMLRVRIDGGQLTTQQLRVIGEISTEFARDTADLTDRQNVQLHWVQVEDVPEIWRRLEAVGLSTTEACGDVPRVILGSPVAGIAADELIDPTPQIEEIAARFIGDPTLANLPRKYKTAITGHPSQDVVHEINDCAFVAVEHPELGIGYDLWVGGALSVVPRLGERFGIAGVGKLILVQGQRRYVSHVFLPHFGQQALVYFLVADAVGDDVYSRFGEFASVFEVEEVGSYADVAFVCLADNGLVDLRFHFLCMAAVIVDPDLHDCGLYRSQLFHHRRDIFGRGGAQQQVHP